MHHQAAHNADVEAVDRLHKYGVRLCVCLYVCARAARGVRRAAQFSRKEVSSAVADFIIVKTSSVIYLSCHHSRQVSVLVKNNAGRLPAAVTKAAGQGSMYRDCYKKLLALQVGIQVIELGRENARKAAECRSAALQEKAAGHKKAEVQKVVDAAASNEDDEEVCLCVCVLGRVGCVVVPCAMLSSSW